MVKTYVNWRIPVRKIINLNANWTFSKEAKAEAGLAAWRSGL